MDLDVRFGVKRTWTNTTLIFVTIEQKNGDRNRCPLFEPGPKVDGEGDSGRSGKFDGHGPKWTVIGLI